MEENRSNMELIVFVLRLLLIICWMRHIQKWDRIHFRTDRSVLQCFQSLDDPIFFWQNSKYTILTASLRTDVGASRIYYSQGDNSIDSVSQFLYVNGKFSRSDIPFSRAHRATFICIM